MNPAALSAALAALESNDAPRALAILRAAGPSVADHPTALQVWALALESANPASMSLALLERAARIAPSDAQAHFNLAVRLQAMDLLPAAIAHYAHTLRLTPEHVGALNNLSDLMRRRGRSDEGYALMQRFLAAGGQSSGQEMRLAKLALDTDRFDEAESWFQAAANSAPGASSVTFEHAMLLLLREDWRRGWLAYEARLDLYGHAGLAMAKYGAPTWNGQSRGAVLIHREQGLGDAMMFASAIPSMIEDGVTVHLAQAPSLVRLFEESFPGARIWSSVTTIGADEQPPQPFLEVCGPLDAQAPVCSLGALRMRDGPQPAQAYLRAPNSDFATWKARLDALAPLRNGKRRVGLCFAARRATQRHGGVVDGEAKSIPAAALAPLADVANTQWIGLHDTATAPLYADARGLDIVDFSPWITDFADTAALIAQLDLVITVDTAVSHLAGGLGAPTWVLLRRKADWRWGVDRDKAIWYPQMRIFRQSTDGDWSTVIAAIVASLS